MVSVTSAQLREAHALDQPHDQEGDPDLTIGDFFLSKGCRDLTIGDLFLSIGDLDLTICDMDHSPGIPAPRRPPPTPATSGDLGCAWIAGPSEWQLNDNRLVTFRRATRYLTRNSLNPARHALCSRPGMPTKLFSFSLLLVALTGCGQAVLPLDPPGKPSVGQDPSKYSDTCAGLFDAYAVWATGCLGTPLPDGLRDDLVAHCAAREALPGINVAPAAFHDCAGKIAASYCASLPLECLSPSDYAAQTTLTWLGGSVYPYYYEVFPRAPGSLAAGEGCSLDAQCQSGTCMSQESCGICIDSKQVGEACDATSSCVNSACQSGVCVEVGVAEGGACYQGKGGSNCLSSLYCGKNGCVPRLAVGSPCSGNGTFVCQVGTLCRANTCLPIHEVHEGDACDSSLAPCRGEGLTCMDGLCRRPVDNVPAGGSCSFDTCVLGLNCVGGTCAVPVAAGGLCKHSDACMQGLTCLHAPGQKIGQCGAPPGEGGKCEEPWGCASNLYCQFTKGGGFCKAVGLPTTECDQFRSCGGSQVCRRGKCVQLDLCSAP